MLRRWALVLATAASLGSACSKSSAPNPEPVAPARAAANDNPLTPAATVPDEARVKLDLAAVRAAIAARQQLEGKNPDSVVAMGLKLHFPSDMAYDAATGTVKSRAFPGL